MASTNILMGNGEHTLGLPISVGKLGAILTMAGIVAKTLLTLELSAEEIAVFTMAMAAYGIRRKMD